MYTAESVACVTEKTNSWQRLHFTSTCGFIILRYCTVQGDTRHNMYLSGNCFGLGLELPARRKNSRAAALHQNDIVA
jgi:hypothetical protein